MQTNNHGNFNQCHINHTATQSIALTEDNARKM